MSETKDSQRISLERNWETDPPGHFSIPPNELDENFFKRIGEDWMLITAAKPDGSVNSMTAAWGGVGFIWQQPVVFCFIRPQRYTKAFVEESSTFSLCFFNERHRDTLNFMGMVSGYNDGDKIARSGLTVEWRETEVLRVDPSGETDELTPYFDEAWMVLFCERLYQQDLLEECFVDKGMLADFYGKCGDESDLHTMYIAAIRDVMIVEGR